MRRVVTGWSEKVITYILIYSSQKTGFNLNKKQLQMVRKAQGKGWIEAAASKTGDKR